MRWNLAESLLLLALDDLEGKVRGGFPLDVGLAAAELLDAAGRERVKVEGWRIEVLDAGPTGDPDLDRVLTGVARHARVYRKPILLGAWLEQRRGAVRDVYLKRLQSGGAVCHTRRRMLGLIPVNRYLLCDFEATAEPWKRLGLAAETGWSARHLGEQFRAETGLSPKAGARVVRFDRARRRLLRQQAERGRVVLAELATECGYYDQAHLAREFRDLAGCPPSALLAEELRNVQAVLHDDWE